MSQRVKPSRLSKRRQYDGCIYAQAGPRQATRSGAEWIQMIESDSLRLEVVGDGSLAAYKGASLQFEIYEMPQLQGAAP